MSLLPVCQTSTNVLELQHTSYVSLIFLRWSCSAEQLFCFSSPSFQFKCERLCRCLPLFQCQPAYPDAMPSFAPPWASDLPTREPRQLLSSCLYLMGLSSSSVLVATALCRFRQLDSAKTDALYGGTALPSKFFIRHLIPGLVAGVCRTVSVGLRSFKWRISFPDNVDASTTSVAIRNFEDFFW